MAVLSLLHWKVRNVGKTAGVLSANLTRPATDTSKFGRWGDNYAYHIGDLSSIVLPGHGLAVQTEPAGQGRAAGSQFVAFSLGRRTFEPSESP